jgi:hypothetical protein
VMLQGLQFLLGFIFFGFTLALAAFIDLVL